MQRAPAVELSKVRFAWVGSDRFELVVDSLVVEAGERLLLVGPSGSGKSTLLSLVCGTIVPSAGHIALLGEDFGAKPGPARDRFRAEHIGVIFQMLNLLPYLSILDNVLLPLSFAPLRRKRADEAGGARAEAMRLLERLGLDLEALATNTAAQLSAGQQQRVAAARALIGSPEIVVADEPTSALDRDRQEAFLSLLFGEVERAGAALVMVSHEERFAARFDRIVQIGSLAGASPGAKARGETGRNGARAA